MMSNKAKACCCFCLLKPSKESWSTKRHTGDLGEEKMCFLIFYSSSSLLGGTVTNLPVHPRELWVMTI